jgi:tetratricopeptide (TPR) repeat protein
MNSCKPSLYKRSVYLILLAAFALPAISNAENYKFELIYADVPGSAEILAGHLDAAIETLENRAQAADKDYVADELATLCALYIAKGQLSAASVTCNDAVETDQSNVAYNNRGVFRTQLGDTSGAMEDFAHARNLPDSQSRYIKELMSGDAELIAGSNYIVAERYEIGMRVNNGPTMASQALGASIEDLGND